MFLKQVKQTIVWMLVVSILLTVPAMASEEKISAYQYPTQISVNGTYLDAANYLINDVIFVPLRAISEGFGYEINWNEDRSIDLTTKKTMEPKLKSKEYQIALFPKAASFMVHKDDLTIRVNGSVFETPHYLYRGTTYVPLAFLKDALHCHIVEDNTISVTKIYSPEYVTFGENDYFYYDGQMLTERQFKDAVTLLNYAMGGSNLTPSAAELELAYLKSSYLVGNKLTDDQNYPKFLEANKIDTMLSDMGIQDTQILKEIILKAIFYQYEITEEDVLSYYIPTEEELEAIRKTSSYGIGHWMKAKHILITKTEDESGKKQAEELLKKVKENPSDFDKLMAEFSQDPGSKTYPDGYVFQEGDMVTEFYEGTLALKVGEISDLVESPYGYHIILKVADFENGVPCEEVKDELQAEYAKEMSDNDIVRTAAYINTVLNQNYQAK